MKCRRGIDTATRQKLIMRIIHEGKRMKDLNPEEKLKFEKALLYLMKSEKCCELCGETGDFISDVATANDSRRIQIGRRNPYLSHISEGNIILLCKFCNCIVMRTRFEDSVTEIRKMIELSETHNEILDEDEKIYITWWKMKKYAIIDGIGLLREANMKWNFTHTHDRGPRTPSIDAINSGDHTHIQIIPYGLNVAKGTLNDDMFWPIAIQKLRKIYDRVGLCFDNMKFCIGFTEKLKNYITNQT